MEEKKGLLAELGKVLEQYDSTEDIVKQNVSSCLQSFSKELGVRLKDFENRLAEIEKRLDDIESKLDKLEDMKEVPADNEFPEAEPAEDLEEGPVEEPVDEPLEEPVEEPAEVPEEENVNEVPTDAELSAEEEAEEEAEDEDAENARPEKTESERFAAEEAAEPEEEKPVAAKEEKSKPDWYDWEVDYPAAYVDDLIASMGLNDKMQFINELFNGKEIEFENVMQDIDTIGNFKKIVAHLREEYPQWDETSDIVYRFYMHIRRKYDIKKAETEE
jgi:chemotaxis protein histidine kinase CheA